MADVFLRLLPFQTQTQAQSHVHHQHDNHMGLFILAGIFLSFIIEKFFRYFQSMFYIEQSSDTSLLFFLLKVMMSRPALHYRLTF
jgi:hypothetical protein